MPRSKRQKVVTLSKTRSKGRATKDALFGAVKDALSAYPRLVLFSVQDMRNTLIKELRQQLKDQGRFFFGRVNVMRKALEEAADEMGAEESSSGLRLLAGRMSGEVGLYFTTAPAATALAFFSSFQQKDYARTGNAASATITLPAGLVHIAGDPIAPAMFEQLTKLGVPVHREKGQIALREEWVVCREGDVITPKQAQLLKLFCHPLAVFRVEVKCWYEDGKVHEA